jgi:prepilin-type N-terminal cleavage/methylation domain-containing protein
MQRKKIQFKKAFTLIETMVAISILLISVIGPLEIASKGLFSAIYAKEEITAFYLAQEGVEVIKNVRDSNYLFDAYTATGNSNWLNDVNECVLDPAQNKTVGCIVDPTQFGNEPEEIITCDEDDKCPPLKFDEFSGIYNYISDPDVPESKFTRTVYIEYDSATPDEAKVVSKVTWSTSLLGNQKSTTLTATMFNWQR